jgi:hypothetical protein
MSFISSCRLGAKLATGQSARLARVQSAIPFAEPDSIRPGNNVSATIAKFGEKAEVLVSYEEPVAFRNLITGQSYSTPRNYFSRTTDRSLADYNRGAPTICEPAELLHKLRLLIAPP